MNTQNIDESLEQPVNITGVLILNTVRNKSKLLEHLQEFFNTNELIIHSGNGLDIGSELNKHHLKDGALILRSRDLTTLNYSSKNVSVYNWLDGWSSIKNVEVDTGSIAIQKHLIDCQKSFDKDLNFKTNLSKSFFSSITGDFLSQLGYLTYNSRPSIILMNRNVETLDSFSYWLETTPEYDLLYWTNDDSKKKSSDLFIPKNSLMLLQPPYLINKWKNWIDEDLSEDLSYAKTKMLSYLSYMTIEG